MAIDFNNDLWVMYGLFAIGGVFGNGTVFKAYLADILIDPNDRQSKSLGIGYAILCLILGDIIFPIIFLSFCVTLHTENVANLRNLLFFKYKKN